MKPLKMRNLVLAGAMAMAAASARADSVDSSTSLSVGQITQELNSESVIPLAGGVGNNLAKTMLYAQTQVDYASLQSLDLSIDSVLKAITLYAYPGGPTTITSPSAEPLVWLQASIAINPALTVTLTPSAIHFGEVAVGTSDPPVATPESGTLLLLLAGIRTILLWRRK